MRDKGEVKNEDDDFESKRIKENIFGIGWEAVAVIYASAAAYVFTYSFKASYFSFFGIPETLASVALEDIVRSGYSPVVIVFAIFMFTTLPLLAFKNLFLVILLFRSPIFLLAISYTVFLSLGVNNFSIITGFLGILLATIELFGMISARRKGENVSKMYEDQMRDHAQASKRSLEFQIGEWFGQKNWVLMLVLLFLPYWAGNISGHATAAREHQFSYYKDDQGVFILVSRQGDEVIAKDLLEMPEKEEDFYVGTRLRVMLIGELNDMNIEVGEFDVSRFGNLPSDRQTSRQWFHKNIYVFFEFLRNAIVSSPVRPAAPASRP